MTQPHFDPHHWTKKAIFALTRHKESFKAFYKSLMDCSDILNNNKQKNSYYEF